MFRSIILLFHRRHRWIYPELDIDATEIERRCSICPKKQRYSWEDMKFHDAGNRG